MMQTLFVAQSFKCVNHANEREGGGGEKGGRESSLSNNNTSHTKSGGGACPCHRRTALSPNDTKKNSSSIRSNTTSKDYMKRLRIRFHWLLTHMAIINSSPNAKGTVTRSVWRQISAFVLFRTKPPPRRFLVFLQRLWDVKLPMKVKQTIRKQWLVTKRVFFRG